MKTLSFAHRGASGHFPENTLMAFEQAIGMNCDGIELDVHLSSDGHVIVVHDDEIVYNNELVAISSLTFAQIKSIQLPYHQFIPLLTDVLDLINKKCIVNIELKGLHTAKAVVDIINYYISHYNWTHKQFIVSSFNANLLAEVKLLNPNILCGIITSQSIEVALTIGKALNLDAIIAHFNLITASNVNSIHTQDFQIFAWTVNDINEIKRLQLIQVDGIISDYPENFLI